MAESTKIEWADHTWSPWRGCTKVSPGCKNCYAERLSVRNPAVLGEWGPDGKRVVNADWRKPLRWDRAAARAGVRRRVFPSLCDPFEDREDLHEPRRHFFRLVEQTPNLDWLVLTKRPHHAAVWSLARRHSGRPLPPNVWIGVSVEDQQRADERIPPLLQTPAAVRWLSVEPLLGRIDLTPWLKRHSTNAEGDCPEWCEACRERQASGALPDSAIDWVVVGGESGPRARPCHTGWVREIVEQCKAAGVPCFVKQLGARVEYAPAHVVELVNGPLDLDRRRDPKGGDPSEWPPSLRVREFPAAVA